MSKLKITVKKQYLIRGIDLLRAREEAGWTQEELAQKANGTLGKTQQNISDIEGSKLLHQISTKAAEALQKLFDVEFEEHTI